jgi:peptidoglycan/LPS O-acetylase OafA/YrhL
MRLKHLDALRGIAALSVTFFHLTGSSGLSKSTAFYGKYGYVGVEMFFVISGFVLPYSMQRLNYKFDKFGKFILKRIIRIYPAYIVAILIGIIFPLLTGRDVIPWPAIIAHLIFANSILHYDWASPVFWTLAIEFQFYLLVGLLFKFFSDSNTQSLILIFAIIIGSFFIGNVSYLFHWFPFFSLGILIYNRKCTNMHWLMFWPSVIAILIFESLVIGLAESLASAFALLFIIYVKMEKNSKVNVAMIWLGAISYSLYLVHWEIGRAIVAVSRHVPILGKIDMVRVLIGMVGSIIAAYILYISVERKSIILSSKLKYSNKEK